MDKAAAISRRQAQRTIDSLAVHVTARVGLHHPVRGFRLTFWCRRALNCTASAHQVHQRVENTSKFAKCSNLEKLSEQTYQ